MENKIARLLVTKKCNRKCVGCCNDFMLDGMKEIDQVAQLKDYKEVIVTGGEPAIISDKVVRLVRALKSKHHFNGKIYMYSATFNWHFYNEVIKTIDGITYTLHNECNDDDIDMLRMFIRFIKARKNMSYPANDVYKLYIDRRVYDKYDFSNLDFTVFNIVRKLEWKDNCPLPKDEELVYFDIDKKWKA